MPKYLIQNSCTFTYIYQTEVEAANEDEAYKKAEEIAYDADVMRDWIESDDQDFNFYVEQIKED